MFLLCIKIFFARICDVSLGTVRTMLIIKGKKISSSLIAFIEVIIWYYAAREALNTNINTVLIPISYALGYSTGTLLGNMINEVAIDGIYEVQVITNKDITNELNNILVSTIKLNNNKYLILIEVNKQKYKECINKIKELDSKSFITIKELKLVYNGIL